MTDDDGDGIFSYTYKAEKGSDLEYFFSYQNGPDTSIHFTEEVVSAACSSENGATSILFGNTIQMEAIVYPINVTNNKVSWSVNDPSIGTIDAASGLLSGIKGGELSVIATATDGSGISGSTEILVKILATVIELRGAGGATSLSAGSVLQMESTILPADATDTSVSWSVDDPTIAIIDVNAGILAGIKEGAVTVTATANDESGVSGTLAVSVVPADPSTSVEENMENTTRFYPNPTTGYIYFSNHSLANIKIYNTNGTLVIEKQNVSSVNLQELNPGIYYISFNSADFICMRKI